MRPFAYSILYFRRYVLLVISFCVLCFSTTVVLAQDLKKLDAEASQLFKEAKYAQADSIWRKALQFVEKQQRRDSVYAFFANKIGNANLYAKKFAEAEKWYVEAKDIRAKVLGVKHFDYSGSCNNMGLLYQTLGQYEKAKPYYEEAMQIIEDLYGKEDLNYASSCGRLGVIYKELKEYSKAVEFFSFSLAIREKKLGKSSVDYANTCMNLAIAYNGLGEYKKAEPFYLEALELRGKLSGKKSKEYALACANIAAFYEGQSQYANAEKMYLQSLETYKSIGAHLSTEYGVLCTNLGSFYANAGVFPKAEQFLKESCSVQESIFGKMHPSFASACSALANLYIDLGDLKRAEQLAREALQIRKSVLGTSHPMYAHSLMDISEILKMREEYKEAEEYTLKALYITEDKMGKWSLEYCKILVRLANLLKYRGDFENAEKHFLELIENVKKRFGPDHDLYANYCNNLAVIYADQGLLEKASVYMQIALDVKKKRVGVQHPDYLDVLTNLAMLYSRIGNWKLAEELGMSSLEAKEKLYGKTTLDYANSCMLMADVLQSKKQYADAEAYVLLAKQIRESLLGASSMPYKQACLKLAEIYRKQGFSEKAIALLEPALKNLSQKEGASLKIADFKKELAINCFFMGQQLQAEELFKSACDDMLKISEQQFTLQTETERLENVRYHQKYFDEFFEFGIKRMTESAAFVGTFFNMSVNTKGRVYSSTQQVRNQLHRTGDSVLIASYEKWRQLKIAYHKLVEHLGSEQVVVSANILKDSLKHQIDSVEVAISKKSAYFAKANSKKEYTWQLVRDKLEKNEVAIEVLRVDNNNLGKGAPVYVFLLITKSLEPQYVIVENAIELETKHLNFYKTCLTLRKEDVLSYATYWKPVEDKLREMNPNGFKTLYFSPDGVYHVVNLASLYDPGAGQFLSETHSFDRVGSFKDFIDSETNVAFDKNAFKKRNSYFFGYPQYNLDEEAESTQGDSRMRGFSSIQDAIGSDMVWPMLSGTKAEVEEICKAFVHKRLTTEVFMGKDATEEKLKSISAPAILHIATHGFFIQPSLTVSSTARDAQVKELLSNPLMRSGLVFAGCSNPQKDKEDGILTAAEAMNLDLDGTELVVLSACETGLGDIVNGEGVFGLQRAFKQAGAKALVMSLWKVSDDATQLLMSVFYKQLLQGKTKAKAFEEAQELLRKKYPHPYYWGAFVLIEN